MLQTISRCSGRIGKTFLPILCRAVPRAECADESRADFSVWFTSEVVLSMSEVDLFFSEVGKSSFRLLLSRARALLWFLWFFPSLPSPICQILPYERGRVKDEHKEILHPQTEENQSVTTAVKDWRIKTCTMVYVRARGIRKTVRNVCRNKTFRTALKIDEGVCRV